MKSTGAIKVSSKLFKGSYIAKLVGVEAEGSAGNVLYFDLPAFYQQSHFKSGPVMHAVRDVAHDTGSGQFLALLRSRSIVLSTRLAYATQPGPSLSLLCQIKLADKECWP